MTLCHLAICKTKILVHYEFKVHIVVGRAKNLQKQANYEQMMAILGHLWQTEGTKKLIIINVWVLVRF